MRGRVSKGCLVWLVGVVAVVVATLYIGALQTVAAAVLPVVVALAVVGLPVVGVARQRPVPVVLVVLALVTVVGLAVSLSALLGLAVRVGNGGEYARTYGTKVQARYDFNRCRYDETVRHGASDPVCHGATWTMPDGSTRTGTLQLSWTDHYVTKTPVVTAYLDGDTAYSAHKADSVAAPWVYLGLVPFWLLYPGVVVTVLGGTAAVLAGRRARAGVLPGRTVELRRRYRGPVGDPGWVYEPPNDKMTKLTASYGTALGQVKGEAGGHGFSVLRFARMTWFTLQLPAPRPDVKITCGPHPSYTGDAALAQQLVASPVIGLARREGITGFRLQGAMLHHNDPRELELRTISDRVRALSALADALPPAAPDNPAR